MFGRKTLFRAQLPLIRDKRFNENTEQLSCKMRYSILANTNNVGRISLLQNPPRVISNTILPPNRTFYRCARTRVAKNTVVKLFC
jgi:hypothetical protein